MLMQAAYMRVHLRSCIIQPLEEKIASSKSQYHLLYWRNDRCEWCACSSARRCAQASTRRESWSSRRPSHRSCTSTSAQHGVQGLSDCVMHCTVRYRAWSQPQYTASTLKGKQIRQLRPTPLMITFQVSLQASPPCPRVDSPDIGPKLSMSAAFLVRYFSFHNLQSLGRCFLSADALKRKRGFHKKNQNATSCELKPSCKNTDSNRATCQTCCIAQRYKSEG